MSIQTKVEYQQKRITTLVQEMAELVLEQAKAANRGINPIRSLEDCYKPMLHVGSSPSKYEQSGYPNQRAAVMLRWENALKDAWAEVEKIHASNDLAIASNVETVAGVRSLMASIGIAPTREVSTLSRGRWKTTTQEAGWVADLRLVPIDDGYRKATEKKAEVQRGMHAAKVDWDRKDSEEAGKREREAERIQALTVMVEVCGRHGIKFTGDMAVDELIGLLVYKNKYLALAHWLMKNREDWTDGYHIAQYAIERFVSETDQDREIEACILEAIGAGENGVDGRIFRDCAWNYNVLFALAADQDRQLHADYTAVSKYA